MSSKKKVNKNVTPKKSTRSTPKRKAKEVSVAAQDEQADPAPASSTQALNDLDGEEIDGVEFHDAEEEIAEPSNQPNQHPVPLIPSRSIIELKKEEHISIGARVAMSSPSVTILVNDRNKIHEFKVHDSERSAFTVNDYIWKTRVTSPHFAHFFGWLYTGTVLDTVCFDSETLDQELWDLGDFLEAPGFQNYVMDETRAAYRDGEEQKYYMSTRAIRSIYTMASVGPQFRLLACDIMNCLDVVHSQNYGSSKSWANLIKGCPALKKNLADREHMDWGVTRPWDDEYRVNYMVAEKPLGEAWEVEILGRGLRAEVEQRAKNEEVSGMVELEHLNRDNQKSKRGAKS
ncbi:uncharacterized protein LY89DRAFT_766027 [Mollisia scopiformis]|uniref:Uncharacterized protein n=1 Tax=Mollisia scopiformis TaxID=149040 RepID=A0A132B628_MOLSC|nr:uncharacterized protein LY89DRAFT_766027 [Mollisia scopiformis]KUJ07449.1 hypothetical protein LY89DRAFT_766027 [Mollisia scopiformis]